MIELSNEYLFYLFLIILGALIFNVWLSLCRSQAFVDKIIPPKNAKKGKGHNAQTKQKTKEKSKKKDDKKDEKKEKGVQSDINVLADATILV